MYNTSGCGVSRYNPDFMNRLALLLLLGFSATAQTRVDPARVERLLQRAVVIDLHDDTTQMIVDEGYNLGEKHDYGQVDIPRMRAGPRCRRFSSRSGPIPTATRRRSRSAARWTRSMPCAARSRAASGATWSWPRRPTRSWRRSKRGHIAILMGVEGGHAIDSDLAVLAHLLGVGRPLPHADAHQQHAVGRYVGQAGRAQRADRFRAAGGAGDEPAGHDGGHFARLRQDVLRRAGGLGGAGDRVAFFLPRAGQCAAQYDRRYAARAGEEGRRGAHQLLRRLPGRRLRGARKGD